MKRKLLLGLVLSAAAGCAALQPRPSVWQMESECADGKPFAELGSCTRNYLNVEDADRWERNPQTVQFLAFIDAMVERAENGQLSEADARLAIASYAARGWEQRRAQIAQAREQLQCDVYAMTQDSPGAAGVAAMGRAMAACEGLPVAPEAQVAEPLPDVPAPGAPPTVIQQGLTKVCLYNEGGSIVARTVSSAAICPLRP